MEEAQSWVMIGGFVLLGLGQLASVLLNNTKHERLAERVDGLDRRLSEKVDGTNARLDRMNGRVDRHDIELRQHGEAIARAEGIHGASLGD